MVPEQQLRLPTSWGSITTSRATGIWTLTFTDTRPRPGGETAGTQYADVAAVRVLDDTAGLGALLAEAWERYRIPLAVTEVHLGCTREEQLRWLRRPGTHPHADSDEGVDVRAVTAWALLGSFDWDSLLTRREGHYEPGAFDVRGPPATAHRSRPHDRRARPRAPPAEHPAQSRPGLVATQCASAGLPTVIAAGSTLRIEVPRQQTTRLAADPGRPAREARSAWPSADGGVCGDWTRGY